MQEQYTEFDSLLRSLAEDAEVKPSRGVWKAVASRLDAAAVQAAPAPFVRRYAWGFAAMGLAAAAVLFGVVISNHWTQPSVQDSGVQTYASLLDDSNVPQVEAPLSLDGYLSSGLLPEGANVGTLLAVAEVPQRETCVEEPAEGEPSELPVCEEEGKEDVKTVEERPQGRSVRKVVGDTGNIDIFTDNREVRSRRPFEVYTKGALGGNDSEFAFNRNVVGLAPGTQSNGIVETGKSVYGVPFSLGIGVRKYVSPRFSVGLGVDYSRLTRTFSGKYMESGEVREAGTVFHALQYVGLPLDLYYDVVSSDRIKFYLHAGGEAEYCLSNKYTLFASLDISVTEPVQKLQYSVGAGLGVEFVLSRRIGIFVDPSVKYYFPCDQPKSVRTERPLLVNFDAGLRFSF